VALLAPLFDRVTAERRTGSQRFNEAIARLFSKTWSAAFLREVLARRRQPGEVDRAFGSHVPLGLAAGVASPRHWDTEPADDTWLCAENEAGVAVDDLDAALEAIAAIRRRGHHRVVAKQALGFAGQSALRLWEPELRTAQRRWLAHALQAGRRLVIEPWLERELDFSAQLEMGPGGLKLCGYTGLLTDRRGQFQGNWAESQHLRRPPARIAALIPETPDIIARILRLYAEIFARLEVELRRVDFVGPVGIDAFVYRELGGRCRLKPIVELNPRYTMGRVLIELMKQTCPGSCGLLRLISRSMAQAEGGADFVAYAQSLGERFPLQLEGEPVPRIRAGAVCLNDPEQAQASLAVFRVERTLDGLLP